ncbi:D-alanyl-D-alanine carboxypeptidase [Streptomyces flaveolus]|uniref:D-alanyl-D-alanine carboxypeptidase n=1 Tax=Streptomyces flaveolus TaxID=67297 RepID=UPI0019C9F310|nr:D-alanyl-D-alanine carboxypeptidase [Streptomyces flaveolus]GGQ88290.1 D-alanyl-D-alanine carboxypeptidase [Streptomyces flaveolus]
MEEASVAGESPDRSKQRESSEEPTSGSAGPVPEARTEASETRDPRLAVAREASTGSAKAGGGVDTATRVLSVRDTETEAATPGAGETENETAADDEAGTRPEAEADAGAETEPEADARTGAQPEAPADAEAETEPEADARTGAQSEAPADAETEPEADAETGAQPEVAAGAKPEAGAGTEAEARADARPDAAADVDADAEPVAVADAEPGAKPGAVAGAKSDARPEAAADAESEPEAGAKTEARPEADADAESGAGAVADGEDGGRPEEAGATNPSDTSGDGRLRDAVAAWVATADERAAANARHEAADEPEDAASPEETAQDADAAPDGPEDASEERAGDRADAGPEPDAGERAEAGKGPVDQPTAVFKAVRPPAEPSVDQPTTMLKLGDVGKKGGKPDKADKAETEAERTSKFVALRHPDDPATRKPPRPAQPGSEAPRAASAGATAAVPQVGPERTTQQPLPPKPPLDLLAELTNTPPPPETPLRTTVRRVKIWTPLVLLLVIVFGIVQAVRPLPTPTLHLTAQETVSFEGGKPSVPWPGQGQAAMDVNGIGTFGTSGDQKPVPIASIAKVMTVYLILRDHPLKTGEKGPKITVDAAAQKHYETGKAENESVVRVSEGQKITEYEALQAVMLPSANNIAKLLARWDTGSSSEDAFVAKMNKTAEELGMKNTTYTDPSGLDKTTVSTAEDLVKLGRAAMENPVFKEISKQPGYVDLNGDEQKNFFGLVPTVAIGIKTGTTTAAGGNILFAAEKNVGGKTQTIIGAALGQYGQNGVANIDEVTGVVRKLIETGQDALTSKTIVKKGDVVGQVDDGLGGTTPVVATRDVSAVGWSGLTVKLKLESRSDGSVPHTAKAGTEVGTLIVGDGSSSEAVEVPVALQDDLAEPGLTARLTRLG